MALYHRATIDPSKPEIIASWVPTQSWCPSSDLGAEVIGAFRFDDPNGRVGMESFMVDVGGEVLFAPLTYRDEPAPEAADAFICETEHSVLGTRWVYDGLGDPLYLTMLAAVSITGQGEALGMVEYEGRWHIAPTNVRIRGGGFGLDRVAVDAMERSGGDDVSPVFTNDGFEMKVARQPTVGDQPTIGLTASWDGGAVSYGLTEVTER